MLLIILFWAISLNWLSYRRGFYQLPTPSFEALQGPSFLQVLVVFGTYLIVGLFFAPLSAKLLLWALNISLNIPGPERNSLPLVFLIGLQAVLMGIIFLLITSYIRRKNQKLSSLIWKNKEHPHPLPSTFDFGVGMFTWLLSFPLVTVLGECIDQLLKSAFGLKDYNQEAVLFVKQAMSSPLSLVFATTSVLILAPLIEEFLFRGVLQNYLKKTLGFKAALLLSSFFFALFHFSPSQGFGNISLLVSLFILGGYLGFLYERQGSLWASIGLHVTFNTVSALRIIFFSQDLI